MIVFTENSNFKALQDIQKRRQLPQEEMAKEEADYKKIYLESNYEQLKFLAKLYESNEWTDKYPEGVVISAKVYCEGAYMNFYQTDNGKIRIDPYLHEIAKAYFEKYGSIRL